MALIEELKSAGFEDNEINNYISHERPVLQEAGFTDNEINTHFGVQVDEYIRDTQKSEENPRRYGIPEGAGEPISTITGKPLETDFGKQDKFAFDKSEIPTWGETLKKAPASGLAQVNVGLARLARDTIKLADLPTDIVRKAFGIKGERPDVEFLEDYMQSEQKRAEVLDISNKLSKLPHWHPKRIAGTGLQAIPQVGAVAGGALLGAPFIGGETSAATMLGAIAYGPSAEEAKAEGANEIQQVLHGITAAEIEVLTELPVFESVGRIWKHLKKSGVPQKAAAGFTKKLLAGLGLYGKGLALESGQELEAYLGGQMSKKLHYDPNATINFKDAVEATYGGFAMSATIGATGLPIMAAKLATKPKAKTGSVEDKTILKTINEGMTTGEIKTRKGQQPFTPEIASVVMRQAYENGDLKEQ
ncbi:MAG: hypothetical protein U9P49_11215, partial [Thermodesulfobacteriota bacterium]|nr:hypothetical protein [Thermodesulfobacteriota bacterium]